MTCSVNEAVPQGWEIEHIGAVDDGHWYVVIKDTKIMVPNHQRKFYFGPQAGMSPCTVLGESSGVGWLILDTAQGRLQIQDNGRTVQFNQQPVSRVVQ